MLIDNNEMYVVTEDGHRLPVDTSSIADDEWIPFKQTVGLYTKNTVLKNVWILELNHRDYLATRRNFDMELVKELRYDHIPTREEILWAMSAYGCTRGDIAIIRKGFELDIEDEDGDGGEI